MPPVNLFAQLRAAPKPELEPTEPPTSVTPVPDVVTPVPDVVTPVPDVVTPVPDVVTVAPVEVTPVRSHEQRIIDVSGDRSMLYYDFETVPDESRFERPDCDPTSTSTPNLDVETFFKSNKTVDQIKAALDLHPYNVDQYTSMIAWEQSTGKPRAGVLTALRAKITDKTSGLTSWCKEHSVNPMKARIVAFGWAIGSGPIESMTARTDDEERAIVVKWYELAAHDRKRCGYNILGFDEALVGIRAMLLDVDPLFRISRRKYGNSSVVDIMQLMFPNSSAMKCKEVAECLKIEIPTGAEMDGSQVFSLYEAGKMDEIAAYVRSDVQIERAMYVAYAEYFTE